MANGQTGQTGQAGQAFWNFAGCSPFFFSGSVSSMIFGEKNRETQIENAEERIAFQKHMKQIQQEFDDAKFDKELISKRESIERGRIFQQIKAKENFENKRKELEFEHFSQYWPLNTDIQAIWNRDIFSNTKPELRIILSRFNSARAKKMNDDYSNTCEFLSNNADKIHNVNVMCDAVKINTPYGIAPNMNIHYIMQGIPTVVISPRQIDETLYFDASIWLYGKGLGSFINRSLFAMEYDDKNYEELKEKVRFVELAIMGTMRDNFMMIEYHAPATFPEALEKAKLEKYPDVRQFIVAQYQDLQKQLESNTEYRALCSNSEIDTMQKSIKSLIA